MILCMVDCFAAGLVARPIPNAGNEDSASPDRKGTFAFDRAAHPAVWPPSAGQSLPGSPGMFILAS